MAGLASVTSRIQLFATCAVLSLPPPIAARMAVTIDSISHSRFGVNIISGWQRREYTQMGIWPGAEHYRRRHEYCAEYVKIMRELWESGRSDFKGDFFQMDNCRCRRRESRSSALHKVMPVLALQRNTPTTIFVLVAGSISRPRLRRASRVWSMRQGRPAVSAGPLSCR